MILEKAVVICQERLGPGDFRMTLICDASYQGAVPGQFVMLRLQGETAPLLPRPFSIHRVGQARGKGVQVQILYRVVGTMTRRMTRIREGDAVDMVGPLGRGFGLPGGLSRPVLVAGGIGVAPMIFLVEALLEKGLDAGSCHFFLGARSRDELLCREELARMGVVLHVTTDDGSAGAQCKVTQPLRRLLEEGAPPPEMLYACGPEAMLQCVARMARSRALPCQVSLEARMACGIGACLGCAVQGKRKDRYLHVCSEGPVFSVEALQW